MLPFRFGESCPNAYGLFSAADLNASVASAQAGITEGKALGQTISTAYGTI